MERCSLFLLLVHWTLESRGQEMDPCEQFNRCPSPQQEDYKCGCDSACHSFGDCCSDVPLGPPVTGIGPEMFSCGQEEFFRVVRCPDGTPDLLRDLCESDTPDDPHALLLVTDVRTGIIYRNVYCSKCHNVPDDDILRDWDFLVYCPEVDETLSQHNQTSLSDSLFYSKAHRAWGLMDDSRGFKECYINLEPTGRTQTRRFCRGELVSDCPETWEDSDIRQRCRTYFSPVVDYKHQPTPRIYKNVYCSICHRSKTLSHQMCVVPPDPRNYGTYRGCRGGTTQLTVPPLCVLFDMNTVNGPEVGRSVSCPDGEVVFSGVCKKLECILPGYKMVDGECVLDSVMKNLASSHVLNAGFSVVTALSQRLLLTAILLIWTLCTTFWLLSK